ncbi:unnamed protein product [Caenorhabditis bovis]|uniref:CYtochrome P450 family n=1 Tax=Caenorhabditis bovis TaxID=2654633 RepID=A0A8S1EG88_9PELO|nr:unnamed protein product [Caenorhabditis bovis]
MLILIIITIVIAWLLADHYKRRRRLPPGPISIPLIGNLHQIAYYTWKTGGVVEMMDAFRKKYGNVFTLWLGPVPAVNLADYESAHEAMVKHGHKYADKYLSPLFAYTRNNRGVLMTNGEAWSVQRRFALQTLRSMGMGKDVMEARIIDELDDRFADIDEMAVDGITTIKANELFDVTVGSIINGVLSGERFGKRPEAFWELKAHLEANQKRLTPFQMMMPLWAMKLLYKNEIDLLAKNRQRVIDYVGRDAVKRIEEVRAGRRVINKANADDFIDAYILRMLEEEEEGTSNHFNVDELKAVLLDLWIAGQETTATTLCSGVLHLLHHPEEMRKIRDELHVVTDSSTRRLSLKDRVRTPYLNATLAEIQRHASILSVNFWRVNDEPIVIAGHPIDAGAIVAAQLSVLHRNETVFVGDCDAFRPSRFVDDEQLASRVIPFGIGKRACLGEGLARAELYLILGNLLLRYELRPHGELPKIENVMKLSILKKPPKYDLEFVKL